MLRESTAIDLRSTQAEKLVRFSKPIAPLLTQKSDYLLRNDEYLRQQRDFAELYCRQPLRTACMNCDAPLGDAADFVKMGIPYSFCPRCTHLNGRHRDTDDWCRAVYSDGGPDDYAAAYLTADMEAYRLRRETIYDPKAAFLMDAIQSTGDDPSALRYTDAGCGSGYFVAALKHRGLKHLSGMDISAKQIALAKTVTPEATWSVTENSGLTTALRYVDVDVVSMIGVLEHLQHPRDALAAIAQNPNVKYFYLLVPMMSLSVLVELCFPNVMQRHLSHAHTHLYTDRSIDYFSEEFGFTRRAEWWFGMDMFDLWRAMTVTGRNQAMSDTFMSMIDGMQGEVDRAKWCSDVHVLFSVTR